MNTNTKNNEIENVVKIISDTIPEVPNGMWTKCPYCGKLLYKKEVKENKFICLGCGKYLRMPSMDRIENILDEGSFKELFADISDSNPINFPEYEKKLLEVRTKNQLDEAVVAGYGTIGNINIMIGVCDTRFLMGSMGHVFGEKITRLFETATQKKIPVVLINCSGGARMQEGIISLMQMAKTAAAVKKHSDAGLLYISILTDPTTGGVAASFSMLGDIVLAEPGALIGFAGPRVIKQTINQELPEGFQRAEFLLEHGFIDFIVNRENIRSYINKILILHQKCNKKPYNKNIRKIEHTEISIINSWEKVLLSRNSDRPTALEYINSIFDEFIELHGDHKTGDDMAIIGGIALLNGIPVTVIAHQKGRSVEENIKRNFGMAHPEGYRKAMRLMKEAEKFKRPIITFVDTPGAACGIEAEERGEAMAIAENICEMSTIKVPILSILIGEGGSGGALGLAVANEVWAMENATYSVLSPEGFASILWKDGTRAQEASAIMKMTADELLKLGVIEMIIPEKKAASRSNFSDIQSFLHTHILAFINEMNHKSSKEIVNMRYNRFRVF